MMKHSITEYKGFEIHKRIDVETGNCMIHKDGEIFKCIIGDIALDGSENSVEKAKKYIDQHLSNSKKVIQVIVSLDITTNKPVEDVLKGVERGIYRGLDISPYNIASPKDVKINYCQER